MQRNASVCGDETNVCGIRDISESRFMKVTRAPEVTTRSCLKLIRNLSTKPSDVLPNGKSASETAHEYIMRSKLKRNTNGRKPRKKIYRRSRKS